LVGFENRKNLNYNTDRPLGALAWFILFSPQIEFGPALAGQAGRICIIENEKFIALNIISIIHGLTLIFMLIYRAIKNRRRGVFDS
jgi:uncharacterized protein HemY